MREVLERAPAPATRDARLALDVYLHRLRAAIAAMAAALGGLDALVFTGGVGEHSAQVRAGAVAGLALPRPRDRRRRATPPRTADADVSAPAAPARTLVIARARGPRDRAPDASALAP